MEIRERPLVPENAEQYGNTLRVERIDYTNGVRVYLQGHTEPYKGMPTEAAVGAIAIIKRLIRLRPFQAMWLAIEPHILKPEYRQPITSELCKMFPGKMGMTIAHVLEYDSAYRLFIMDMLSETTAKALLANPFAEVWRLLKINKRRCGKANPDVRKKMLYFGFIFMFLLCLPKVRKAFRDGDFAKLQLDANDRYWINLRTDYAARA